MPKEKAISRKILKAFKKDEVLLDVTKLAPKTYKGFIEKCRSTEHGIFDTCIESRASRPRKFKPKPLQRIPIKIGRFNFFDVKFIGAHRGVKKIVSCRFSTENLYVIAFHPEGLKENDEDVWYALDGWWTHNEYTPDIYMKYLDPPISVSYTDLEKVKSREQMTLGRRPLNKAIRHLSNYRGEKENYYLREHLLLVAQMVSESIRFPIIFHQILKNYKRGTNLGGVLVRRQNNYSKDSREFTRNILKEMMQKGFAMSKKDFNKVSVILEISEVKYENYGQGLTVFGTDDNIQALLGTHKSNYFK